MDAYVRIVLLIVGVLILIGVIWDIWRRSQFKNFRKVIAREENSTPQVKKQYMPTYNQQTVLRQTEMPKYNNSLNRKEINLENAYLGMPMANRQLETIMPSDPQIVKVNTKHINNFNNKDEYFEDDWQDLDFNAQEEAINEFMPIEDNITDTIKQQQLIISLSVIARMQRGFPGYKLLKALTAAGLVYGKMRIFHRYADALQKDPLFSVSAAVEPGFFDLNTLNTSFIPGITLFMCVDNKINGSYAFDLLVRTAKQLGFSLNGELKDQQHRPLTIQTIENYRRMIAEFMAEKVV